MNATVTPGVTPVESRCGTVVGHTTGLERDCQLACCGGTQIRVAWPDGRRTWCCTEGLLVTEHGWRIS